MTGTSIALLAITDYQFCAIKEDMNAQIFTILVYQINIDISVTCVIVNRDIWQDIKRYEIFAKRNLTP